MSEDQLSNKAIKLSVQGLGRDQEEIEVLQPLIRSIEMEVGTRLVSLNKLATAELIKMHDKICN